MRTRHVIAEPGIEVDGSAWLKAEKAAPDYILVVDLRQ